MFKQKSNKRMVPVPIRLEYLHDSTDMCVAANHRNNRSRAFTQHLACTNRIGIASFFSLAFQYTVYIS